MEKDNFTISESMDFLNTQFLDALNTAPQHFEFYHLGTVQTQPDPLHLEDYASIGFHLYGDKEHSSSCFLKKT